MVKRILYFSLVLIGFACQQEANHSKDTKSNFEGDAIRGLASVIRMPSTTHIVFLQDYFKDAQAVDSISISDGFSAQHLGDSIAIESTDKAPLLGVLNCWVKGQSYQLLCIKSRKEQVSFKIDSTGIEKLEIAGEMSNWAPMPFKKTADNQWELEFELSAGKYQYQLILDENWILDPWNKVVVDNGIGGQNSLLQVGADSLLGPSALGIQLKGNLIELDFENYQQPPIVFWENFQLNAKKESPYQFKIPAAAKEKDRSHLRIWAVSQAGVLTEQLFPLENGEIIQETAELSTADKHSSILYFMLVDRFYNGNKENDDPLKDPEVEDKANYWGGDLAGIKAKLEDGYFEELGINTIWLSPITQNPLHAEVEFPAPHRKYSGYHGYWPISATKIDHRFGTSEELKALVDLAHSKGMRVILDYVSNHVHDENPIYQKHPDWATILDLPDGRKNIRIWDEHRLTTWFDTFLPTIDFSKLEAVDLMSDSALYMLETYNLDGFRHDATKHIPTVFWRTLTQKIKKKLDRPIYQIGETFGSRELIGSYVGSGQMDGQFDFNLYFDLRSILATDNGSFKKLNESILASIEHYGTNSLMGNITGNHDIARFISYAGKAMRFDEDDKAAGWERDIQVKDTVGYRKLELLQAYILTAPGIPVIYYGDELGMPGAGDPDNRRPMKFEGLSDQEAKVKANCQELIQLRKNNMALIYGDFQPIYVSDKTYAYRRTYLDQSILIILHNGSNEKTIKIEGEAYTLAPYSYKIFPRVKNPRLHK